MVRTSRPSACNANIMQLFTALPSTNTVQLPQSPVPHPSFAPVNPRLTRKASSKRSRGATSALSAWPLRVKRKRCFFMAALSHAAWLRATAGVCPGAPARGS